MRVPAPVLAQAWRGGRQARVARFVKLPEVEVSPFAYRDATEVGLLLAVSGTTDVVDGAVAVLALRHREGVVTSNPEDIARLSGRVVVHAL